MPTIFQEIEAHLQRHGSKKEKQNFAEIKQLIQRSKYDQAEMKMRNWNDREGSCCFYPKPTICRTKLATSFNQLQGLSDEEKIKYLQQQFDSVNPESKIVVYAIVGAESESAFKNNPCGQLKTIELDLLDQKAAAKAALKKYKKVNGALWCVMVQLHVPRFYLDACEKGLYKWFNYPALTNDHIDGYFILKENGKIKEYFNQELDQYLKSPALHGGRQ